MVSFESLARFFKLVKFTRQNRGCRACPAGVPPPGFGVALSRPYRRLAIAATPPSRATIAHHCGPSFDGFGHLIQATGTGRSTAPSWTSAAIPTSAATEMQRQCSLLVLLAAVLSPAGCYGLVLPTPMMGWSTWNTFGCYINETMVTQSIHALAASPLYATGILGQRPLRATDISMPNRRLQLGAHR